MKADQTSPAGLCVFLEGSAAILLEIRQQLATPRLRALSESLNYLSYRSTKTQWRPYRQRNT
jgi:hypothetical protein